MSELQTPTLPETLAAKIAALPFTVTQDRHASGPDSGPDEWRCELAGKEFRYSKGTGLRRFVPSKLHLTKAGAPWSNFRAVDPTALELLASLISDASLYEDSSDLDDFAANYCEGMKVQATLDCYNACADAGRFLRQHFTAAELGTLSEWANQQ